MLSDHYLCSCLCHDGVAFFIRVNAVGVQVRLAFLFRLQHYTVKVYNGETVLFGQLQQPLAVAAQGFVMTGYVTSSLPAEQGAFCLGQDGHADVRSFFLILKETGDGFQVLSHLIRRNIHENIIGAAHEEECVKAG